MVSLNQEQRMLVQTLTDISENEFAPKAWDMEEGEFPWDNLDVLAERGYLGINYPEEYGGAGMSDFEALLMIDTVGRYCPETAMALNVVHMLASHAVLHLGTEKAKAEYLPPIIEGNDALAIAISEPQAGSDVTAMETTVSEDDGTLLLNGEKIWVSRVVDSSAAVVWAKFPDGLGAVVMDFDDPGVEIAQHFTNMAGHKQTQFYIEDVEIPEYQVLTRGRDGFKEVLQALNWERLGSAVVANATGLCAFRLALEYAQTREQFDQPIAEFQGIQWKLADMYKRIESSRTMALQLAKRADSAGQAPPRLGTSLAKLSSAEMVEHVASESLQIHGANGYQQGEAMERLYRLARSHRLAGGTDEIMKNQIARELLENGIPAPYSE